MSHRWICKQHLAMVVPCKGEVKEVPYINDDEERRLAPRGEYVLWGRRYNVGAEPGTRSCTICGMKSVNWVCPGHPIKETE